MSSLYDKNVGRIFRETKKPFPFTVDIIENNDFLVLAIYEDEIVHLADNNREAVFMWLMRVKNSIEEYGVRCELTGLKGSPRRS